MCVKIMIIAHHFNIDNWFQMNHSYKNRICYSVAGVNKGRGILVLESIWLDKHLCGAGWVMNVFGPFSQIRKTVAYIYVLKVNFRS